MRHRRRILGQEEQALPIDDTNEIISLFHHIHHEDGEHEVHHCGGDHVEIDPAMEYTIEHCGCGKHTIDKQRAIGHDTATNFDLVEVEIEFKEKCPEGGWHVESGSESPETTHEGTYKRAMQPRSGVVGRCVASEQPKTKTHQLAVEALRGQDMGVLLNLGKIVVGRMKIGFVKGEVRMPQHFLDLFAEYAPTGPLDKLRDDDFYGVAEAAFDHLVERLEKACRV